MGNRTLPRRLAATIAIAAVAAVAGIVGAHRAGAQELDAPVSYEVGDVLVFGSRTRNPSCSITRNLVNRGAVPLRVLASATWDGQLAHVRPNQGSHDGDQVIQPGEQVTAVWTNHDYVADGQVWLGWSVMLDSPVDQIGVNRLETVPACQPASEPPDTVPPTSSTTPDTVPATSTPTDPPPSTSAPDPVEPTPPSAPGPEATPSTLCTADCGEAGRVDIDCDDLDHDQAQAVLAQDPADPHGLDADRDGVACEDTGVLTSSTSRLELAATGATAGQLKVAGAAFMAIAVGVLARLAGARRKVDADRNHTEVAS